jgi:predicted RNA methylase
MDIRLQIIYVWHVMEEVFPLRDGIDYTRLSVTAEGEYSVTRRRDSERIMSIISKTVGGLKTKTVTDATGCVGGDTIPFALQSRFVNSIELNDDNFIALQNNVDVYGLENVTLHHGDCTTVFNWRTDILFVDPPWGGPTYKDTPTLELFLSAKRLDEWLEDVLLRKIRPSYIFLKLPHNYNFNRLNFLSNIELIKPYRIRNYILVSIRVHQKNEFA